MAKSLSGGAQGVVKIGVQLAQDLMRLSHSPSGMGVSCELCFEHVRQH